MIESKEFDAATGYLVDDVKKLARAGADFGVLAAGTPHIIFDDISSRSPIPLLSIVETTCEEARALALKRIGLFGTRFTMQGRFFPEVFSREGISKKQVRGHRSLSILRVRFVRDSRVVQRCGPPCCY